MNVRPLRNIGIFAHVDAGKTTISEQMLLMSGAIRTAGSVDRGTAHTDTLPVEQRRGISVQASCVKFTWKDVRVNLIDTPGHADFSSEIERSLWALDGAVLLISAVDGVEPQTELLYRAFRKQNLPFLIFVNKMDREGADLQAVLKDIAKRLTPLSSLLSDETTLLDAVTSEDEALMETYLLEGSVPYDDLLASAKRLSREGKFHPIFTGSAIRKEGVPELLDAILNFLPPPPEPGAAQESAVTPAKTAATPAETAVTSAKTAVTSAKTAVTTQANAHNAASGDAPCCVVFGLTPPGPLGRGAYVRLYRGRIANRETLNVPREANGFDGGGLLPVKISQIRDVNGDDIGVLRDGEIGIVYGLTGVRTGMVLGDLASLPRHVDPGSMAKPLMTVQVLPDAPERLEALRAAMMELSAEDPLLGVRYIRHLRELHLNVMGRIHLEILTDLLKSRFGLTVTFSEPSIIYKETIREAAIGTAVYLAPKPCWAILNFKIEPGERGSGITYESEVTFRDIPERYQHQVEQALPLALAQGRQGWEATDLRITLVSGGYHHVHTHPLDFIVATPWAIQDGLEKGGSVLLEPILEANFLLPEESVGKVMGDIVLMRGETVATATEGDRTALIARIPAAESLTYTERLAALTGGRGSMGVRLAGYRECPPGVGHATARRNVDPLDQSRYILAARSALEGGIFDI